MFRRSLQGCLALLLSGMLVALHGQEWRPARSTHVPSNPHASSPPAVRLGQPVKASVGLAQPSPVTAESRKVATSHPAGVQQVSLAAPTRDSTVVRAQGSDEGVLLHAPTPVDGVVVGTPGTVISGPVLNGEVVGSPIVSGPGGPIIGNPAAPGMGPVMDGMLWCCSYCSCLRVGAGLYWVQPHWEGNPAYTQGTVAQSGASLRQQDFSFDSTIVPRVWLAYVKDCGLGIRGSAWRLEQSADATATVLASNQVIASAAPNGLQLIADTVGDHLTFGSDLKIGVYDLEILQELKCDCWTLTLSGGARYAHLSQNYEATSNNPDSLTTFTLSSGQSFRGVGPTAAVELRRPVGCCGLAVYGTGRGALLYGHRKQLANGAILVGGTPVIVADAMTSGDDLMPITELEVGVAYTKEACNWRLVLQAGFVGMVFFGAGNGSNSDQILIGADSNNSGNLGLVGLSLSAGIYF